MGDTSISERKRDHLRILRHDPDTDRRKFYFDNIRLVHRALPDINYGDVDTSITFLGKKLSFPLMISCMTGGHGKELQRINRHLATAAEITGIAMGTGSQRIMLEQPSSRSSFLLRDVAPSTLLCGNLGAVQLNYGVSPQQCAEIIEQTGMDALCLHLNPLQEVIQPEGNTCFKGLDERIRDVVRTVPVPVIVKEVGTGMCMEDAKRLIDAGVRVLDVAGAGGTSWSRIEDARQTEETSPGRCFQDWGISTPDALRALSPLRDNVTIMASGGIRTGLDMAKAMVLGASLCGVARPFLELADRSVDAVLTMIEKLRREFQTAMFLMGVSNIQQLIGNDALLQDRDQSPGNQQRNGNS